MDLFKKIMRICFGFLSFLMLFQCDAFAVKHRDNDMVYDSVPKYELYMRKCTSRNKIEIRGALGNYFLNRSRFGKYTIYKILLRTTKQRICDIITEGANRYLIRFDKKTPCHGEKWRIFKPEGCSYWIFAPDDNPQDTCQRKIYIRKCPQNSDLWEIESECTKRGGGVIKQKIAITNIDSRVYGETIDIFNFLTAIIQYPDFCRNIVNVCPTM